MANFLALCQDVARESGTVSGTLPVTTAGQTGRLGKIVSWTVEAWRQVQNEHTSWRFHRKEFSGAVTASTKRYTPASWSLDDHRRWITGDDIVTLYATATGVSDEGVIAYIGWENWRRMYDRGSQTANRPIAYAISPANEFCIGPVPDAGYTLRGEYWRTAQILAADDDEPICPEDFHQVIVWKALQLLVEHDEAPPLLLGSANAKYRMHMDALRRDQLDTMMVTAAPIA